MEYRRNSTIYISAEMREFDEFIAIARRREYGIEVQAFAFPEVMYGDWKNVLDHYKEVLKDFHFGIANHHAFYDAITVSRDHRVVEATREKFDFNFKIAMEIGAKIIIAHFHWWPFWRGKAFDFYVDEQLKFWDGYINLAERKGLLLVMENTVESRPEYIIPIIERANSSHFQIIFDPGHANLFSAVPLTEWIKVFNGHLRYIHFHNNSGADDEHSWNDRGTIDFDPLFSELSKQDLHPIFSTELYNKDELYTALSYLEERIDMYGL